MYQRYLKLITVLSGAIRRFRKDSRAGMATMVAIGAVPLVGFSGLAVDSTRGYMLRSQLVYALDAAGLAGGKELFSDKLDVTIDRFFAANFPDDFMQAAVTGPEFTVNDSSETLTVTASATIPTTFMQVLGINDLTVSATTVVQRSIRGMELALVMDNTGSMRSGNKMTTMKTSAMELVSILYGDQQEIDDFFVSLVPYTVTVNIGAGRTNWLDGSYDPTAYEDVGTEWRGCVEARAAPLDQDDTPPSGGFWSPFFYPTDTDNIYPGVDEENNSQNDGTGPNLGCGPAITSLTASRGTIEAGIQEMQPWHRGGTMGNLGLAWGWRVLSPQWRGLWGGDTPATMPLDYDEPLMDKVVVMLTDGNNQWYDHPPAGPDGSDYGAYGRIGWGILGTTSSGAALNEVNNRMAETCELMKAEGIKIFTITFQVSSSSTRALYQGCASSPDFYFNSPTNEDLTQTFRAIGTELSNLRIAQ
ncbi:MAG: pilus assembly protein [Alphaproteobacteria bacterium]